MIMRFLYREEYSFNVYQDVVDNVCLSRKLFSSNSCVLNWWLFTVKKAERQSIEAFQLWCWIRLLRVPWTARRSNQSILKEISPGCLLEGLMLKLRLQYFGHLMWRVDSLEKTLMLGGIGGTRRRGRQRMRCLDSITDRMDMSVGELREFVMDRETGVLWFTGSQRVGHDWATELNWTEPNFVFGHEQWLKKVKVKVAKSCSTLCDPIDFTVHEILQARILEWVAFPFSRDLPNRGIESRSPVLQADSSPAEPQGKQNND